MGIKSGWSTIFLIHALCGDHVRSSTVYHPLRERSGNTRSFAITGVPSASKAWSRITPEHQFPGLRLKSTIILKCGTKPLSVLSQCGQNKRRLHLALLTRTVISKFATCERVGMRCSSRGWAGMFFRCCSTLIPMARNCAPGSGLVVVAVLQRPERSRVADRAVLSTSHRATMSRS
jgi:hypothetical protein